MTDIIPDAEIDLRGEVCPFTFVKAKLALEDSEPGTVLRILVDFPPASVNVPKSLAMQGDEVLRVRELEGPIWEIVVRKSS